MPPREVAPKAFDPKAEIRLAAIQGVGTSIEQRLEEARQQVHVRQGVIMGLLAAERQCCPAVMAEVQRRVDLPESSADHMDGEVAKVVLRWLQEAVSRCAEAASLNGREKAKAEGVVEGLAKAVEHVIQMHAQEHQKAQRRAEEAAAGGANGRDAGGRPVPVRERTARGRRGTN